MRQGFQYQSMKTYMNNSPMTNFPPRNLNYPNIVVQQDYFTNSINTRYQDDQSNHPIYEGVENCVSNFNSQSRQNQNGLSYSNISDFDPIFFSGNDYDNATAPALKSPGVIPRRNNSYKPPHMNGSSRTSVSSQVDRQFSLKSCASSPQPIRSSITQNYSQSNSLKFENIRKICFATKTLFSDQDFPPIHSSLSKTRRSNSSIVWMRPPDIVNLYNQRNGTSLRPELINSGSEVCNLNQGDFGDCWIVAALASLTCHDFEHMNFLTKVIPLGQSFRSGWYSGAFLFRFWRNGDWKEVIVDDFLPTKDGRLIYISSIAGNEFWGSLLEKAYAKLNGSYDALEGGQLADCLDDFTGGMTESYSLNYALSEGDGSISLPGDFDDQLIKAYERHSIITTSIIDRQHYDSVKTSSGVIISNGLVAGHAYTISDIRKIKLTNNINQQSVVTLIRVRNPWGSKIEWNGSWSDSSSEWLSISENDRKAVGLVKRTDGEFWISMNDFLSNFDTLDICHIHVNLIHRTTQLRHSWHCSSVTGNWKAGISAGGRPKFVNTHFTNPQFLLNLKESQDGNKCNVLIGLLQDDVRGEDEIIVQRGNLSIGFVIYQVKSALQIPLNASFLKTNSYIGSVDSFINSREVVKRFRLPLGSYVIIPSTYEYGLESRFLLRAYVESPNNNLQTIDSLSFLNSFTPKIESVKEILQTFEREAGQEMSLTAFQLQRLINALLKDKGFKYEISIDACKAMIQLFDKGFGMSGSSYKLSEDQFPNLWAWLLRCLKQIQAAEAIGPIALKSALDGLQLQIPSQIFQNLLYRFGNESGTVVVSNFITIVSIIKKANEFFDNFQKNNAITLSREEYLNSVTRI